MLCSWKNIKERSSWDNDSTILLTGVVLLFLYLLLTFIFSLIIPDHLARIAFKHAHQAFNINKATESHFISFFTMIWHIFWISAISGFIGNPIARVIEGCLGKQTELQYTKLANRIQTRGSSYHCKWNTILLTLQENHYVSELNRLKKYIINGDTLNIPSYKGVIGSIRHLKRISDILLEVENIMQKEGMPRCENKLSYYRSRIRLLHFKTDLYKHLTTLQYFIYPAIIALLLSYIFERIDYLSLSKGTFAFFLGIVLIISAFPFATLAYSAIGLFAYFWRKQSKRYDDMVFKTYALAIALTTFLAIFLFGVWILAPTNNPDSALNLKVLFSTASNIVIPLINSSSEHNLIRDLPASIKLVIQISTAIIVSMLIQLVFKYVLGKYKQSTSGDDEKFFTIPAELINIFGVFFIFIIATALIYSSIVSIHRTTKPQIESSLSSIPTFTNNQANLPSGEPISATVNTSGGGGPLKVDEKPKSIGNFLPYSIFLALVGAVLAISTRELLENYFSGISMKVDMPFEQGDRIQIENVGMCEVREIGLRSVNLYSIANNSIVSIPNKDMSTGMIENFTKPTLDYRRSLSIHVGADLYKSKTEIHEKQEDCNKFIKEFKKKNKIICKKNRFSKYCLKYKKCKKLKKQIKEKKAIEHDFRYINDSKIFKHSVVESSRRLLLIAAFLTTGVQRPTAKRFFCYNWVLENEGEDVQSPDRGMKHRAIKDIKAYKKRGTYIIDKSKDLFSSLESVASTTDYRDIDRNELDLIWYRLKLIQKINEQPLIDLLLMDVPHLLDDASLIKENNIYMDTDYVTRSKVRVAKVLYLLHILESEKYGMSERDFAGSKPMSTYTAWVLSTYVTCITEQYYSINELLWGLKKQSAGQTGKKTIDSARLKFQNIPRVKAEQKNTIEGYAYWEFTLSITVALGEQSDEILYNINKRIDWYWKHANLFKVVKDS